MREVALLFNREIPRHAPFNDEHDELVPEIVLGLRILAGGRVAREDTRRVVKRVDQSMAGSIKQARGNDNYIGLLQREHPAVYLDLQAGKHATVAEALKAAGVKKARTRLQELLNAWSKATSAERRTFRTIIDSSVPAAATAPPFAIDGYLQPEAVKAIRDIMVGRSMKMGNLMDELGRKRLNPAVGLAMNSGSRLQPGLLDDLEAWVTKQFPSSPKS